MKREVALIIDEGGFGSHNVVDGSKFPKTGMCSGS